MGFMLSHPFRRKKRNGWGTGTASEHLAWPHEGGATVVPYYGIQYFIPIYREPEWSAYLSVGWDHEV